jgi:hypothetical protein
LIRPSSDGWHLFQRQHDVELRAWMRRRPRVDARYAAHIPFDDLFELRAHAARRLWRVLSGHPPGPDFRQLPAQRRGRLIQSLRALDASQNGASYRAIAVALFGSSRTPAHGWKTHDLRNRTIRLVQTGDALTRGGYRELLHYPIRHG